MTACRAARVQPLRRGPAWRLVPSAGVAAVLLLALATHDAGAASLGSVANAVGPMAALAALLLVKGWPAHLPGNALSTATGLLVAGGATVWLWRSRAPLRLRSAGGGSALAAARRPASLFAGRPAAAVMLPADVDRERLLTELRLHFVELQAAWDLGSSEALKNLTTPDMLNELNAEWAAGTAGRASNRTDVVTLQAELLGFEDVAGVVLASVEFSGLIRESSEQGASQFRELWMLAKSKHGPSRWRLARQQALI